MPKYKHIKDFTQSKSDVFRLMDHLDTVHNTFEEGGWSVVRVHDKFIVHDTPIYGGQEQFIGIFDETEIAKLIDVLK